MIYDDVLDDGELTIYASAMNSRAKSLGKAGRLTIRDLRHRIYESGGRCEWCGVDLVRRDFELDHILYLSGGGTNHVDNLAVACPDCNRRKASKHPAQFAQEIANRSQQVMPLVRRVLDHYQIDLTRQLSLFTDHTDSSPNQAAPPANDEPPSASDADPPPYIW
jgi:hypothetical protein